MQSKFTAINIYVKCIMLSHDSHSEKEDDSTQIGMVLKWTAYIKRNASDVTPRIWSKHLQPCGIMHEKECKKSKMVKCYHATDKINKSKKVLKALEKSCNVQ